MSDTNKAFRVLATLSYMLRDANEELQSEWDDYLTDWHKAHVDLSQPQLWEAALNTAMHHIAGLFLAHHNSDSNALAVGLMQTVAVAKVCVDTGLFSLPELDSAN